MNSVPISLLLTESDVESWNVATALRYNFDVQLPLLVPHCLTSAWASTQITYYQFYVDSDININIMSLHQPASWTQRRHPSINTSTTGMNLLFKNTLHHNFSFSVRLLWLWKCWVILPTLDIFNQGKPFQFNVQHLDYLITLLRTECMLLTFRKLKEHVQMPLNVYNKEYNWTTR